MNANELMIDDWVYDTILQGYTRVKVLTARGIKGDIHDNIWDEDTFAPIPLTPEILEKNFRGYKCGRGALTYFIYELKEDYFIRASAGSIDLCKHYDDSEHAAHDDIYLVELRYVHTIQHALRLCGIEKEIKL